MEEVVSLPYLTHRKKSSHIETIDKVDLKLTIFPYHCQKRGKLPSQEIQDDPWHCCDNKDKVYI